MTKFPPEREREKSNKPKMASKSAPEGLSAAIDPSSDPNAFKLAVAVALLRHQKKQQKLAATAAASSSPSTCEAVRHWKDKAKKRKQELLRLKEDLKQLEDGAGGGIQDLFSQIVSCRCHFFDGCGELGTKRVRLDVGVDADSGNAGAEHGINEVLRRRFLRLVRWNERKKSSLGSAHRRHLIELNIEDEIEHLSTSANFLVEISDHTSDNINCSIAALSHQAVDFILASMKNLLLSKKHEELLEEIANGLIIRLTKRMCSPFEQNGTSSTSTDPQFCVQHVIRRLGSLSYIGQRIMLSLSQRICVLADNLLSMDPFDEAFPDMHDWMFILIELMEFLIPDFVQTWTSDEDFNKALLEQWLRSTLQARKALELLECRNGLYLLYMERVTGVLAKQLELLSRQGKLDLNIISYFSS